MSSLQVGLAVAGGLILGGVIAYNTWNARRNEPRQAQPESQPAPLVAERVEPTIDGSSGAPAPERVEPAFDTPSALQPLGPLPVPDKRPRLDALIDVIAPIALDGRVVSGDALLAALPATRRVGSKPFAVEAQNEDSGEWEHPVAGQRYTALQAGVQLANRTGALNEIEYSEFVMKAQRYADAVGGAVAEGGEEGVGVGAGEFGQAGEARGAVQPQHGGDGGGAELDGLLDELAAQPEAQARRRGGGRGRGAGAGHLGAVARVGRQAMARDTARRARHGTRLIQGVFMRRWTPKAQTMRKAMPAPPTTPSAGRSMPSTSRRARVSLQMPTRSRSQSGSA